MKYFLVLFCVIFASQAAEESDETDKKFFKASEECVISEKMPAETLKELEKLDSIPDNMLCLYKCIFEKIELINKDSMIVGEKYSNVPGMPELEEKKTKELIECLNKVGKVEMCEDIRKVDQCYDLFVPA